MLQRLLRRSGNLLVEIISFCLLLPVLLLSVLVLLATGKFRAFVFWKRKEKRAKEKVEGVVEVVKG